MTQNTQAYRMISDYYGKERATRSQVPLINHINEGLLILDAIGAYPEVKDAFCIHPMVQRDQDLANNYLKVCEELDSITVLLAMEYRNIANNFLSFNVSFLTDIDVSPVYGVNQMLIADKVQNRKDFEIYHKDTHQDAKILELYFQKWLDALGVNEERYQELRKIII